MTDQPTTPPDDSRYSARNPYGRKANQQWELAGLARQDGDRAAEEQHTKQAREYEQQAREWEGR